MVNTFAAAEVPVDTTDTSDTLVAGSGALQRLRRQQQQQLMLPLLLSVEEAGGIAAVALVASVCVLGSTVVRRSRPASTLTYH